MAQWITRLTTDQKIPGSNPGKLESPILRVICCARQKPHTNNSQRHTRQWSDIKGGF